MARAVVESIPRTRANECEPFNGVKVFSATMLADRAVLGEKVTAWIAEHPELEVAEIVQTQSSDAQFHCVALTVFYRDPERRRGSVLRSSS